MRLLLVVPLLLATAACAADTTREDVDRIVTISMRDNEFEPDRLDARRGETITFRFRNRGDVRHDAFIGNAAAQRDHERDARMADDDGHGGHAEEAADAITVEPGDTGTLTYTFDESAAILIGCHEPGHYEAGMVVTIGVE